MNGRHDLFATPSGYNSILSNDHMYYHGWLHFKYILVFLIMISLVKISLFQGSSNISVDFTSTIFRFAEKWIYEIMFLKRMLRFSKNKRWASTKLTVIIRLDENSRIHNEKRGLGNCSTHMTDWREEWYRKSIMNNLPNELE